MIKLSSNLKSVYAHHSPNYGKQASLTMDSPQGGSVPGALNLRFPYTYDGATDEGKIPAAAILALLGGGAGAAGGYFASDDKNKKRNAIIAGLLGAGAGGAAGYFGAGLPTGIKGRNTMLDHTVGGQIATGDEISGQGSLGAYLNDLFSYGNSDTPTTVGQAGLAASNYAKILASMPNRAYDAMTGE